jgi:hypothetical protein
LSEQAKIAVDIENLDRVIKETKGDNTATQEKIDWLVERRAGSDVRIRGLRRESAVDHASVQEIRRGKTILH